MTGGSVGLYDILHALALKCLLFEPFGAHVSDRLHSVNWESLLWVSVELARALLSEVGFLDIVGGRNARKKERDSAY